MKIHKQDVKAYAIYAGILAALLVIGSITGCAAFNKLVTNNALVSQLAVESATARVLHDHPNWKNATIRITAGAMAVIDGSVEADLASIDSYVKEQINWGRMTPEDQVLVSTLISQIRSSLEDSFRAHGVTKPDAQMVVVRQVLGWINETAQRQK